MTPEAQRIAIAKALGAKWYLFDSGHTWISFRDLTEKPAFSGMWSAVELPIDLAKIMIGDSVPDYPNDLNACREMENVLGVLELNGQHGYRYALIDLVGSEYWRASAAQRCEAFLRTKGIWKESQP